MELIEHSERQDRAEELAILKEEVWTKVLGKVHLFVSLQGNKSKKRQLLYSEPDSGSLKCHYLLPPFPTLYFPVENGQISLMSSEHQAQFGMMVYTLISSGFDTICI